MISQLKFYLKLFLKSYGIGLVIFKDETESWISGKCYIMLNVRFKHRHGAGILFDTTWFSEHHEGPV